MAKDNISKEDRELFRQAAAGTRPMKNSQVSPTTHRHKPVPAQRQRDEQQALQDSLQDPPDGADMQTGEELRFARDGVAADVMRKLRRGQIRVEAELDLHRHTSIEARIALSAFLSNCMQQGRRCIRIIHGKGLGSFNKIPVLKGKVAYWLAQRDEVLAYCSARPVDGGSGAVYVLLRRG